ncbi:hypothetical protein OIDMADRAFT_174154 [Oidiodendron maius Zn]|uniref:Uncharacterized protein n=1 Tax=Oidiodendron maius (strain Zn) TaxID=913774 RepID=A0A0C3HY58_OIDMZ|nr:hypothetical protein OIDMADRAFT_174154 [Oidiodendron maius Zn]
MGQIRYYWACHECFDSGISLVVDICANCGHARCKYCNLVEVKNGEYITVSDDEQLYPKRSSLKPTRQQCKERIVATADAPPIQTPPPQLFADTFTAPSFPDLKDDPIIVDEWPLSSEFPIVQPEPDPREGDSLGTNDGPRVPHDRDRIYGVMNQTNAINQDQDANSVFRMDDLKETLEEFTSLSGSLRGNDMIENLQAIPKFEPVTRSEKTSSISPSSSIEPLQSLVDSIFSIASLSSASTLPITENAFQRVSVIFKSDAIVKMLYKKMSSKTSSGKFNRNFGTLLKRFRVDLEKEATCWNEQRAAQFLRGRARQIAQRIADEVYATELESGKELSSKPNLLDHEKVESFEDSGVEEELDEFLELQKFTTNSEVFQILHEYYEYIRGFLRPRLERSLMDAALDIGPSQLLAELPFAEEDQVDLSDERVYYEHDTSYRQWPWPLIDFTHRLQNLLLPEPQIPDGMARACGELLYDDYRELKPGAAKRFEDLLQRSSFRSRADNSKGIAERFSNMGIGLRGLISYLSRSTRSLKSKKRPGIVDTELRYYADGRTTRTPSHTSGEVFYLLLCHNDDAGAEIVKLRQPDICDINNDEKLFNFLREEYKALRKCWRAWISLWTLQSIKFVRFDLYENELVDVKKLDEVPPPTKDNEYRHGPPNPPELSPPLGSTLLMHLFKHPTLAGTRKLCLKKIPRKLQNRLIVLNEEDDATGWGLQFVEGWSKKRLIYMTALTVVLSSLVEIILVAILGHDIQNAAAIASFMLSFVTVGIATAQAGLHMS